MKKIKKYIYSIFIFSLVVILTGSYSYANHNNSEKKYTVTITNVTSHQVITPPLVIVHQKSFELFKLGDASSEELASLAEDGNSTPLQTLLDTKSDVLEFISASDVLLPGDSISFEVTSNGKFKNISIAGMLASSNDAFFAVNNFILPNHGIVNVMALVYDAGSEENTESCDFVPGPPCGSSAVRDTENAEGFVYIHSGIHGIGDLDNAMYDWRGPAANIIIQPVSK